MQNTDFTKPASLKCGAILAPLIFIISCVSFSPKTQVEIFSPKSDSSQVSEKIWYSELHGGASQLGPNDMLVLRLKGGRAVNVLIVPKPTYRSASPGMLGRLTAPVRLYRPEDPNLFVGLIYDDLQLRPGKDCFKISFEGQTLSGEVTQSTVKAQVPVNPRIFPKENSGDLGSLEMRFPVDPYTISGFRLLTCTVYLNEQAIQFPEIDFSKIWQDRLSP